MIWSIIPEELVFAAGLSVDKSRIIDYRGRKVRLRQGRIDLLLSSDPRDFLDRRFCPGAAVDNSCKSSEN